MYSLIILFIAGILAIFLGAFEQRKLIQPVVTVGTLIALVIQFSEWNGWMTGSSLNTTYASMIHFDAFALGFGSVLLLSAFLIFLLANFAFRDLDKTLGDNLGLMLFSLCGALCLFSYSNAVMLFLGIEIMSIPLYVLAASKRTDLRGNEAGLKYFLQGAFATGVLLFGLTLVYGSCGTFDIQAIGEAIRSAGDTPGMLKVGIIFVLVGLGFKIAAVPFHFWSPDVYDGSPNLVTLFMSTAVKTASFVAFYKLFSIGFGAAHEFWSPILVVLAALSMTLANFVALFQNEFKRMMAYSSISHTGYMLLAVLAFAQVGSSHALLMYTLAYSVANIGAFAVFILVSEQQGDNRGFSAFQGLGKSRPYLALAMVVCMISLAGIPPTAGFFGKFLLFKTAFAQYPGLVILAIVNSAVSIAYYFRVFGAMYFSDQKNTHELVGSPAIGLIPPAYSIVLGLSVVFLLVFLGFGG